MLRDHPLFYLLVRSVLSFSTCSLPSPSQYLSWVWHTPSANIPIQPLQSGRINIHSSSQGRGKIAPADSFYKSLSPGPCATNTSQMASPHGVPPHFVSSKGANYLFLPCFEILTVPITHTLFQLSCFPHSRLAIRICNLWVSSQTDELLKIQPLQAPIQLLFLYFLLFIFFTFTFLKTNLRWTKHFNKGKEKMMWLWRWIAAIYFVHFNYTKSSLSGEPPDRKRMHKEVTTSHLFTSLCSILKLPLTSWATIPELALPYS